MQSIREIYKIGRGPSSSHTMGPEKAAKVFLEKYKNAESYKVILYGSLAKTGKGHHTDLAINSVLGAERTEIVFDTETVGLPHENTMDFFAYSGGEEIGYMRALSVGGGDISVDGLPSVTPPEVYPENSFEEIAAHCKKYNLRLSDYVYKYEGESIKDYLATVWQTMKKAITDGLSERGILEGGLNVERKAAVLFGQHPKNETDANRENRIVCAYAFAVSEQNAAAETIAAGIAQIIKEKQTAVGGQFADVLDQLNSVKKFYNGLQTYTAGVDSARAGANQLSSGALELKRGAEKLQDGAAELYKGTTDLYDGTQKLAEGGVTLRDGVKKLKNGAGELRDGMEKFDEEGIQKITNVFEGDLNNVVDRLHDVADGANAYNNFSGIASGATGKVKFIFKTAGIGD